MTKPRILRITRPYESVEDYIQAEGWTISTKRMILLDQPRFDRDTIVRFELSLQNGEKLIRAEARVVGYQTATPDKPGGPKVRFKRFGGTTKSFIQQVVAEHGPGPGLETIHPQSSRGSDPGDEPPSDEAPNSLRFSFPAEATSEPAVKEALSGASRPLDFERLGLEGVAGPVALRSTNFEGLVADGRASRQRLQALIDRSSASVSTPKDRDALLARLRARARGLSQPPAASDSEPVSDSASQ